MNVESRVHRAGASHFILATLLRQVGVTLPITAVFTARTAHTLLAKLQDPTARGMPEPSTSEQRSDRSASEVHRKSHGTQGMLPQSRLASILLDVAQPDTPNTITNMARTVMATVPAARTAHNAREALDQYADAPANVAGSVEPTITSAGAASEESNIVVNPIRWDAE